MKYFSLLLPLLFSCSMAFAQSEKYLQVKIEVSNQTISTLASAGIPVDAGFFNKKENAFTTAISESDFRTLQNLNIPYTVEIEDLTAYYVSRNAGVNTDEILQQSMRAPSDYPVPYGFELGSCGGFSTIEQFYDHLDNLAYLYPNLITEKAPASSLTTIQGRTVYYVKISDNPYENEDEPQVLYTGMIHAREPIGMQHLLFYMYYILERYETDPEIKTLIDNTEMYFIPIVNPDGYQHNINNSPNGGGMWRKNRRTNSVGFGVDLNRNFGYSWGYDDEGSSPYPTSETYRGTAPFSEPETQIVKEFCEAHDFKIALNYHSYSNLLLYPWGYTPETCPDDFVFYEYSKRMTFDNQYTYGPGSTTIYPSNGGSDDWMYGEQTTKNKILAYTPEIGSQGDGFWPSVQRIIPQCQENMLQSLLAAKFSGPYAEISDVTPMIIPDKNSFVKFDVKRLGQTPATYIVSIEPLGDKFLTVGEPIEINNLEVLEAKTDSIAFELSENVNNGDTLRYVLTLDNGLYTTRDTIVRYYGMPVIAFSDDFPDTENWSGQWGLYGTFPYSPPYSIADSPTGNYANNANTSFTLNESIDLTNASVVVLNFYARWRIEAGYDYVQVRISTNNGATWTPLEGKYTKPGTNYQLAGQPLYDGIQNLWVREEINLSPWAGNQIKLRFTLRSDAGLTADGFFFDDLTITMIDITTGTKNELPASYVLKGPWPNPSNESAAFEYELPSSGAQLVITDLSGKEIMRQTLEGKIGRQSVSTSGLSNGLYLCKLILDGRVLSTVKLIKN
ncbi:MAG: immune inhibitor A [Lentimicrobium sp.]|nr:immune inhibitor A [Lentimicrobium sp.]